MPRIDPVPGYEHLRQLPGDGNRYEILEGRLAATRRRAPGIKASPRTSSASRSEFSIVTPARIEDAPDLIVEVLSDSTRDWDLGARLRQYARHKGLQLAQWNTKIKCAAVSATMRARRSRPPSGTRERRDTSRSRGRDGRPAPPASRRRVRSARI